MKPAALLAALCLLASTVSAARVCHDLSWMYYFTVRLNTPARFVDHAGGTEAQQAFEEVVPQVTKAITREGHLPKGARLRELLPIEGCFRSIVPSSPKKKQFGQYGFFFKASFEHEDSTIDHYVGVWSDNKRHHPHVEVFRYKLF